MKKEQTLLLVTLGVAGLLVYTNAGLYTSVGASTVPSGKDIEPSVTTEQELRPKSTDAPPGRSFLRQKRVERRKEPPKLELPPSIGLPWVRPLPWPGIAAQYWSLLREPMAAVAKPGANEEAKEGASAPQDQDEEDPAVVAAREAAEEKAKEDAAAAERRRRAARTVSKDGRERICRIQPVGAFQGQPVWVILEKWPQVPFLVEELNQDGKTVLAKVEISDPSTYQTVHLEKTLENEYHEERIRRGVKESDRTANIEFAGWIREKLAPQYGLPAIRLALTHLGVAKNLQIDAIVIGLIGDACQEAYDVDEEVQAYRAYLQGSRAEDTAIIVRLGDAYERGGALIAAREQFEKAAKLGDIEGRLRLAAIVMHLARDLADADLAWSELEKAEGAGTPAQRARALEGMARIALLRGQGRPAVLALAKRAAEADPKSFVAQNTLGLCLYAVGQFAEAEQAFAAALVAEAAAGQDTHARSNKSMALLAQDKLEPAIAEAQGCLDRDPLNYFDPLVVLGEAQQRWGDLSKSNDYYQTALQRNPRNAWILLRLAAIRLRDGRPQPALALVQGGEGVTGLLHLIPESVDALHVAGLVCASQETPDWTNAVKYLQRAYDKEEPKRVEILYDLAKTLHLAGRTEEAIRLLARDTDSNTGFAKNDARALALLAYTLQDGGRPVAEVFSMIDRVRRAPQAAWTKEYTDRLHKLVWDWDRTKIAEDDFKRAAGNRVGAGWDESENFDVQINLDGDRCVFKGSAKAAPTRAAMTGIRRNEELQPLQSLEFQVKADTGFEFVCHLYQGELPDRQQGETTGRPPRRGAAVELGLGRERDGRMLLYVYGGDQKQFMVPVKDEKGADRMWPDDGQFHRIAFKRIGLLQDGEFEIWLDDEQVAKAKLSSLSAQHGKSAQIGVHVDADPGAKVDLQIESVQVERIQGRGR